MALMKTIGDILSTAAPDPPEVTEPKTERSCDAVIAPPPQRRKLLSPTGFAALKPAVRAVLLLG